MTSCHVFWLNYIVIKESSSENILETPEEIVFGSSSLSSKVFKIIILIIKKKKKNLKQTPTVLSKQIQNCRKSQTTGWSEMSPRRQESCPGRHHAAARRSPVVVTACNTCCSALLFEDTILSLSKDIKARDFPHSHIQRFSLWTLGASQRQLIGFSMAILLRNLLSSCFALIDSCDL